MLGINMATLFPDEEHQVRYVYDKHVRERKNMFYFAYEEVLKKNDKKVDRLFGFIFVAQY